MGTMLLREQVYRSGLPWLDQAGIIYSLKHFPGMGKSEVDPHTEQYRITASKEILLQEDTIPFKNIIQNFDNQDFMVMVRAFDLYRTGYIAGQCFTSGNQ